MRLAVHHHRAADEFRPAAMALPQAVTGHDYAFIRV
jgi:hypothetical protein